MFEMQGLGRLLALLSCLSIVAAATFPVTTYKSINRTSPQLRIQKSGGALAPGYLIFSPAIKGDNSPYIMSDDGDLIWVGPPVQSGTDFRVQTLNNQTVLTLFTGENSPYGFHYGGIEIIDSSYHTIQVLCPRLGLYVPNFSTFQNTPKCQADAHEGEITRDGTMMVTAYNVTQTDLTSVNGGENDWVIDGQFYEIDIQTGKVLFSWKSLDHVPVSDTKKHILGAGKNDTYPFDYFHINAVQKLANGRYAISSRNTCSVYYIGTDGKIIWTFQGFTGGDFAPLPQAPHNGAHFAWQHDAKLRHRDGTKVQVSMFNNNNPGRVVHKASSGLLFELDTSDMSSTLLQRYHDPNQVLKSWKEGNFQPLSETTLLSYGSVCIAKEYASDNATDVRMTMQFGYHDASYRVYRSIWHGTPTTPLDVAVRQDLGLGYVSWNGATQVKRYIVYAGTTKKNLKKEDHISKTGFETTFVLPDSVKNGGYVRVDALGGFKKLGSSDVIKV